jgi:hypothetical protein
LTDRGAEVGVQHRGGGDFAGAVPVTAVEPVPAHPEEAGADGDHRQVVRGIDLAVALQPRPDHRRRDEAGDPGGEVDDVAARVVDRALLSEEAAAPDHEGVDGVDQQRPEGDEGDPGFEVEASEHRAQHQDRGDRRKDDLEVGERRLGEEEFFFCQLRDVRLLEQFAAVEDRARLPYEVPEEAALLAEEVDRLAEAHLEPDHDPEDQDDRKGDERHHHRVHGPAFLHDAAVEHDQAGDAHQPDQGGGGHLP